MERVPGFCAALHGAADATDRHVSSQFPRRDFAAVGLDWREHLRAVIHSLHAHACIRSVERVPGLYAALHGAADATDGHDVAGNRRGPRRSSMVDIDKDVSRTANFANRYVFSSPTMCN